MQVIEEYPSHTVDIYKLFQETFGYGLWLRLGKGNGDDDALTPQKKAEIILAIFVPEETRAAAAAAVAAPALAPAPAAAAADEEGEFDVVRNFFSPPHSKLSSQPSRCVRGRWTRRPRPPRAARWWRRTATSRPACRSLWRRHRRVRRRWRSEWVRRSE